MPVENESAEKEPPEGRQYSRLLALPTELIGTIASFLEPEDLCSLRLTCNACYERTQHCFGTLLTKLNTGFSDAGLDSLLAISQDPRFNHRVRSLRVVPDWLPSSDVPRRLGHDILWERDSNGCLKVPQPSVQRIHDALVALVNCQSFEISNYCEIPVDEALNRIEPSEALRILLYIISETALPLKSLLLDWAGGVMIYEKYLDLKDLRKQGFLFAMPHLQRLSLEFSLASCNINWITEVARAATNLRTLRFTCDTLREERGCNLPSLCLKTFEHAPLEEIFLCGTDWPTAEHFIAFLRPYRSHLRTLELNCNSLHRVEWVAVLQELRDNFPLLTNFKFFVLWQPIAGSDCRSKCVLDLYKLPTVPGSACVELIRFDDIIVDRPAPKQYGTELLYTCKRPAVGPRVVGFKYSGARHENCVARCDKFYKGYSTFWI